MNGEHKESSQQEDGEVFDETATIVVDKTGNSENVGDTSVEINVDELISEVEAAGLSTEHYQEHAARKKLDEILEEKRMSREFSDFEDFDID